ncbi:MAG: T9SS type A sorting domain-containing protein [Bacteroidota bacterium]
MKKITLIFLIAFQFGLSQNYTEYFTGNATDVNTNHESGVCLMGGATENDNAMIWFLDKTNGGDVVVLRASGSDGYNDYFYTDLGVNLNSVTTFVIDNEAGAIDPYVLERVENAEAIWFAGGDQWDYVSFFKDNAMEDALNNFINVKQGVIGGTSAGMAILGSAYFSAENGTVTNATALSDPYHSGVALGYNDFLEIPFLENAITDTHYDDPDRRPRHTVFLARFAQDNDMRSFGIACEEFTSVCIDSEGKAYVYGDFPNFDDYAYFLQANCSSDFTPETLEIGEPVTWNRNGEAVKAYKVGGTASGANFLDLTDWETGSGGEWEHWSINNGNFTSMVGTVANCATLSVEDDFLSNEISIFPNPFSSDLNIQSKRLIEDVKLFDSMGREIEIKSENGKISGLSKLNTGVYFLKVKSDDKTVTRTLLKR